MENQKNNAGCYLKWECGAKEPIKIITDEGYETKLKMLQKEIGGYVTYFQSPDFPGIDMWCDDEGLLKNKPISVLLVDKNDTVISMIKGNVVMAKFDEEEGETLPLDKDDLMMIMENLHIFTTKLNAARDDENAEASPVMVMRYY